MIPTCGLMFSWSSPKNWINDSCRCRNSLLRKRIFPRKEVCLGWEKIQKLSSPGPEGFLLLIHYLHILLPSYLHTSAFFFPYSICQPYWNEVSSLPLPTDVFHVVILKPHSLSYSPATLTYIENV